MTDAAATTPVLIQLLHVPDCPLLDQVRDTMRDCLVRTSVAVEVIEMEGSYPSPTLVIDGIDVTTGAPPLEQVCCRFDLPTCTQILQALSSHEAAT